MARNRQPLATHSRASVLVLCAALMTAGCSSFPFFRPPPPPMPPPEPMPLPQAMADTSVEPPVLSEPTTEDSRARTRLAVRRPPPKPPMTVMPPPPPPAVSPGDLVGSDYAAVLKVLRRPDRVDNSALSVVWSYSDMDCRLQLFFYPDIETTKFHLVRFDLKNAAGEKVSNTDPCMQQFMARNDGAVSQ